MPICRSSSTARSIRIVPYEQAHTTTIKGAVEGSMLQHMSSDRRYARTLSITYYLALTRSPQCSLLLNCCETASTAPPTMPTFPPVRLVNTVRRYARRREAPTTRETAEGLPCTCGSVHGPAAERIVAPNTAHAVRRVARHPPPRRLPYTIPLSSIHTFSALHPFSYWDAST